MSVEFKHRRVFIKDKEDEDIDSTNPLFVTQTPRFKHITDNSSASVQYFGYADPGTGTGEALWLITKQTVSETIITLEFANGSTEFTNIWDNRATYDYS